MILCVVALMGFAPAQASTQPCPEDPHPCGNEWPDGLNGPFDLAGVRSVKIGGSSELILPVAEGGFGGLAPTRTYPPRPFTPPGYTD